MIESVSTFLEKGRRLVSYAAFDRDGHVAKASRQLIYTDYHSPKISCAKPFSFPVGTQDILDNATRDANEIRRGAIQYTDDMLKSLQTIMNHTMEGAQGRFDAFMNSMKSSYDIVSSNRKELSSGIITEKEESAEPEKQDSTEA